MKADTRYTPEENYCYSSDMIDIFVYMSVPKIETTRFSSMLPFLIKAALELLLFVFVIFTSMLAYNKRNYLFFKIAKG